MQRAASTEVRTGYTFVFPKLDGAIQVFGLNECAPDSDLNVRRSLPLPTASDGDHLSSSAQALPPSVIPRVVNFATYDRFFLHISENV